MHPTGVAAATQQVVPTPAVGVRAEGWGWRYATRRAWAVRGLHLDVRPGERVLLLGASGAGKSTLLAALAGLLDPGTSGRGAAPADGTGEEEGRLLLDGVPARETRRAGVLDGHARTGLLLQDPQAQTVLARCGDDVAFGLENHAVPPGSIWPRVDEALRAVAFPYGRDHSTARLSGGERQRLALAGVLALRPGLLLLDEPTAMLDPDGAAVLREQVDAVLGSTGATCLVVEHRVAEWLPLVDRVVVLAPNGGATADGPAAEVLRREGQRLADAGIWVPGHTPAGQGGGAVRGGQPGPVGRGESGAVGRGQPGPVDRGQPGPVLLGARALAASPAAGGTGRSRRGRSAVRPAVRDVDLELRAGRITCVVGPNGAGKSTLALALAGLAAPLAGEVRAAPALAALDGHDAGSHPHRWRPRQLVRRIGTVFQDPRHQFVATTVAEELSVGPRRVGAPEDRAAARVAELLERLGLTHLARANPFTLSGGEQRRLSVATALATSPGVLVLDEPTFGQDARTWAELVDLLVETVERGAAAVVVTHDEQLVETLRERGRATVLRLDRGRPVPSLGSAPAGDAVPPAGREPEPRVDGRTTAGGGPS